MARPVVRQLEAAEYDQWDRFVARSHQGMLFHKSFWLGAAGQDFRIYGCFKGEKLLAGLPIVCGVSASRAKYSHHPPLTPYLGIVFKESEGKYVRRISEEKSSAKAIADILRKDFDLIHFSFTPFVTDLQPFLWEGFTGGVSYTYLLEIDDLQSVWNRMDPKRRNNITRAEKDGIHVERTNDFPQIFALVEKTFERQDRGFKPSVFKDAAFKYNEILRQRKLCSSFLAKNKDGKAIAAVYIVWDERRSYYILGGYDFEQPHHGATATAVWEAIKFSKTELGLAEFDFEGSMLDQVERFFRGFGGVQIPYFWVRKDSRTRLMRIAARAREVMDTFALKLGLHR